MSSSLGNNKGQKVESNIPGVMQKMKETLKNLGAALDNAMDLQDPMNHSQHEIGKVTESDPKLREMMHR